MLLAMSKKEVVTHLHCIQPFTQVCCVMLHMQDARTELQRAIDLPGTYPADRVAQDAARTLMAQHFK